LNPLQFPLLGDENIQHAVIAYLSDQGYDVRSLADDQLGQSDAVVLHLAHREGRVVLTHDADFGMLVIAQNEPFTGIVYLRPGHIQPTFTIHTLKALAAQSITLHPPFIVVAERRDQVVKIRTRQL
jgi:predicted nuclease of predicted toxin-antitoxin system